VHGAALMSTMYSCICKYYCIAWDGKLCTCKYSCILPPSKENTIITFSMSPTVYASCWSGMALWLMSVIYVARIVPFVWLISRTFSANKQYFSLTTYQPMLLSVVAYQPKQTVKYRSYTVTPCGTAFDAKAWCDAENLAYGPGEIMHVCTSHSNNGSWRHCLHCRRQHASHAGVRTIHRHRLRVFQLRFRNLFFPGYLRAVHARDTWMEQITFLSSRHFTEIEWRWRWAIMNNLLSSRSAG